MDSKKNQQMGCGKSWSEKNFVSKCKDRKLRYFGHVTKHKCLEKDIIQATLPGNGKSGRPKTTCLNKVTQCQWTEIDIDSEKVYWEQQPTEMSGEG